MKVKIFGAKQPSMAADHDLPVGLVLTERAADEAAPGVWNFGVASKTPQRPALT